MIEEQAERTLNRREFIKLAGATALCACAGTAAISGCSSGGGDSNIPLAPEASYHRDGDRVIVSLIAAGRLEPVGGAVRLTLDGGQDTEVKIVVVHSDDEVYRAFANRCTHRGKELDYLPECNMLRCRSGKAQFDLEGSVLSGPAERALLTYPTRREGDQVFIEV
jgi:nitrite reductase/ring-hydroxylating ferredoxin subunit